MEETFKEDDTCNDCETTCEETLYGFRCYQRMQRANGSLEVSRDSLNRRLHPCRAFISKKCAAGLLHVE